MQTKMGTVRSARQLLQRTLRPACQRQQEGGAGTPTGNTVGDMVWSGLVWSAPKQQTATLLGCGQPVRLATARGQEKKEANTSGTGS